MSQTDAKPPRLPPRWFIHVAWRIHRFLYRISGGRFLWTPASKRGWGALRLTTVGRRTGRDRSVIIGYLVDGSDVVTLAMNGWGEGHPAWWLNLEANPEATIRLAHEAPRKVRARRVTGEEEARLWKLWQAIEPEMDAYSRDRSTPTPVIVFDPR